MENDILEEGEYRDGLEKSLNGKEENFLGKFCLKKRIILKWKDWSDVSRKTGV